MNPRACGLYNKNVLRTWNEIAASPHTPVNVSQLVQGS